MYFVLFLQKINEEQNTAKTSSEPAAATAGPSTSTQPAEDDKDKEDDKDSKKKKNRCAECRKKVGLTGKISLSKIIKRKKCTSKAFIVISVIGSEKKTFCYSRRLQEDKSTIHK